MSLNRISTSCSIVKKRKYIFSIKILRILLRNKPAALCIKIYIEKYFECKLNGLNVQKCLRIYFERKSFINAVSQKGFCGETKSDK